MVIEFIQRPSLPRRIADRGTLLICLGLALVVGGIIGRFW